MSGTRSVDCADYSSLAISLSLRSESQSSLNPHTCSHTVQPSALPDAQQRPGASVVTSWKRCNSPDSFPLLLRLFAAVLPLRIVVAEQERHHLASQKHQTQFASTARWFLFAMAASAQ